MRRPRYFDGRVRRVVAVRYGQPVCGRRGQRIETLECGHEKQPWTKSTEAAGHLARPMESQYRVCFECTGKLSTEEGD